MWLIFFEDTDCDDEIFDDEEPAKERYKQLLEKWAVHLFKEVKL